MRDRGSELGLAIWLPLLVIIAVAILTVGGLFINQYTLPWSYGIRREAVQESKSFVDSTNSNLANLKTEYSRLQGKIAETEKPEAANAYKAQQGAVIEQMCIIVGTMDKATVDQSIRSFISENGGC